MVKIVIDPGYYDGNTMLKLAKYLGEKLILSGANVIYTRTTDTENLSVSERGRIGAGADLFVSLHSAASEDPCTRGVTVFYSVKRPESEPFATALGEAVADVMDTPFIASVTQVYPNDPTQDYSRIIYYSIEEGAKNSFLIEHGFNTNEQDYTALSDDETLKQIAETEATIITDNLGLSPAYQHETHHIVQPGESLYSIGQKFDVPWEDIAKANNILPPYTINPGQQLIIPTSKEKPLLTGIGFLKVKVRTGDNAIPIENAFVKVKSPNGETLYESTTDVNGDTTTFSLAAPNKKYTFDPEYMNSAYSVYNVDIAADGYTDMHIHNVEIIDSQTAVLIEQLKPLISETNPNISENIDIEPIAMALPIQRIQDKRPPKHKSSSNITSFTLSEVIIPDYITVHLGAPTDGHAKNTRVHFIDYIKNVASSEIYPTWPTSALAANILAIITFTLNRIYTEWYPSRGYHFNITNSTAYDQSYRENGPIYESISNIVDNLFNSYAHRAGIRSPFFTSYCNGTTSTCEGLSQWGTVALANEGRTPLEILRYFYKNDLALSSIQNIGGITESFPGYNLTIGKHGEAVQKMQNYLNRIQVNYPGIPLISNPNGVFGVDTENAVKVFQDIFNLPVDGIIKKDTWNKISSIYVGIAKLAAINSEGDRFSIGINPPNVILSQGSKGEDVNELQFILNAIAPFYPSVPAVIMDSVFGPNLKNAVMEFQKTFNLPIDGIVNPSTWNKLYLVYKGIEENVTDPPEPLPTLPPTAPQYPGTLLQLGSTGLDVTLMQNYLQTLSIAYPSIPSIKPDGVFGSQTQKAVIAFQNFFGLTPDGIIGPLTWNKIVEIYQLVTGESSSEFNYPGYLLKIGSRGNDVKLMQSLLAEISKYYPSVPSIAADGIFGPLTEAAVRAFQSSFDLAPDGIIGPLTWNKIVEVFRSVNKNTPTSFRLLKNDHVLIDNAVAVPFNSILS